jgi:outer membrane protein TolC
MKFLLPFFLLLAFNQSFSQTIFKEEEFIAVVKKYHPVAKLASLQVSIAKADLISKQGAFDPVVTAENSRKDFGGVAYYNNQDATIKIPTWYGIDLYAGVENVRGARTNPEQTIGSINYVGFNLPLLQNMVMDKRRAALQQAKLMINETEAVQQNMLNDLIREGLNAYWQWWRFLIRRQACD